MSEQQVQAAWVYVGEGVFVPGIPARDLTEEEMAAFEEQEPGLRACGLYVPAPAPQPRRRGTPSAEAEVSDASER